MNLRSLPPEYIMALTIWGEARGEPIEGQIAVGNVIYNRVLKMPLKDANVHDICLAPKQFSCWNENDPNRAQMMHLAEQMDKKQINDRILKQCIYLAEGILHRLILDNTLGNVNYMTNNLFYSDKRPNWAMTPKNKPFSIGNHVFFTA